MAVADASFSTVKVSMSLGLTKDKKLLLPLTLLLSRGTPSTITSGSLEAFREEPPLTRMVEPLPGAPPELVITTPALLPTNKSCGEVMAPRLKSLALTTSTEPVASDLRTDP